MPFVHGGAEILVRELTGALTARGHEAHIVSVPFRDYPREELFAGAEALSGRIQIWGLHIPFQFLGMLPYLLTIIVVAGAMGRAVAPAADGKPYRKA